MFAKRHYEAIAARLRNAKVLINECAIIKREQEIIDTTWDTCCEELATLFERDNSRFDRDRFLLACCDTVQDKNRLVGR